AAVNGTPVEALVGDITTARFAEPFDLVLAADLLYERAEFEALARALGRQVAPGGTLWVADPQRVDTATFYQALGREGFAIREVCVSEVREECALLRVRLIALQRAGEWRLATSLCRYGAVRVAVLVLVVEEDLPVLGHPAEARRPLAVDQVVDELDAAHRLAAVLGDVPGLEGDLTA